MSCPVLTVVASGVSGMRSIFRRPRAILRGGLVPPKRCGRGYRDTRR